MGFRYGDGADHEGLQNFRSHRERNGRIAPRVHQRLCSADPKKFGRVARLNFDQSNLSQRDRVKTRHRRDLVLGMIGANPLFPLFRLLACKDSLPTARR